MSHSKARIAQWGDFAQALHGKVAHPKMAPESTSSLRDHHLTHAGPPVEGRAVRLSQGDAGAVRPRYRRHVSCKGLQRSIRPQHADVIVSLDADFLSGASYPGFHKLVADYAKRRKDPANGMNRLYTIESSPTTTGMKAEHRLGLRASEIPAFAAALAAAVGASGASRSAIRLDRRATEVSRRPRKGPQGQQRQKRCHPRPLSG